LYEQSCKNSLRLGWLHRPFALMTHDPQARVVTYARPNPRFAGYFISRFADRPCYYLDHNDQYEPNVLPCAQAREQLTRPFPREDQPDVCPRLESSAEKLWLLLAQRLDPTSPRDVP
jgi:hypothetical protein